MPKPLGFEFLTVNLNSFPTFEFRQGNRDASHGLQELRRWKIAMRLDVVREHRW
jgi:hypothetical protein